VREILSMFWPAQGKRHEGTKEEKSQEVFISRMHCATSSGRIQTKLIKYICLTDFIERAKFDRYNLRGFGAMRFLKFPCCHKNLGLP